VLASRSTDGGRTWSTPATLIFDTNTFFDDKDSITADPTDALLVYAVWDRLTPTDTGPSTFARSTDGGITWEPARSIYDPGTNRQTLNNQIVVLPNGTLVDFLSRLDPTSVTLQVVTSGDKGLTWSGPITISVVQSLGTVDPATGQPVRDGSTLGSIAVGPHGELAVAWQDSRFANGAFDAIAFSRSLDGGMTWSTPVGINAVPTVAAWEPTIAFRPDGTMAVSYYDFRSGGATVSSLPTDYWITQSGDGIVWRETHLSGPFDLSIAPFAEGLFLGDYQALGSYGEFFVPFFVQTNDGDLSNRTDVFVRRDSIIPGDIKKKALAVQPATLTTARQAPPPLALMPELTQRLRDNAQRVLQSRRHSPRQ
jgi:hypothetical protein